MAIAETELNQAPVYDDGVRKVLANLEQGKTRDELSDEMGYANHKSLDMYMRRRNFRWNAARQNYEPMPAHRAPVAERPATQKAAQVISLLGQDGADPKAVAKRLGFKDHLEMAQYMKGHGYRYDNEIGNYVRQYGQMDEEESETGGAMAACDGVGERPVEAVTHESGLEELAEYMPILELLRKNKDKLVDLLVPGAKTGEVPRFTVPGMPVTKSVHMSHLLDQMVRAYSTEKNISQRDIVQTAIIEFFRRYGYERQIETLLQS